MNGGNGCYAGAMLFSDESGEQIMPVAQYVPGYSSFLLYYLQLSRIMLFLLHRLTPLADQSQPSFHCDDEVL